MALLEPLHRSKNDKLGQITVVEFSAYGGRPLEGDPWLLSEMIDKMSPSIDDVENV